MKIRYSSLSILIAVSVVSTVTSSHGAGLSVKTGVPSAARDASLCVGAVGCADAYPDAPADAPAWAHPACVTQVVVTPSPIGSCTVSVTVPVSGVGPARSSVKITVTLKTADNRVWAHPVERAIDENRPEPVPNPTDPPSSIPLPDGLPEEAPLPERIDVPPVPVEGIGFAEVRPGSWSASRSLKVPANGRYSTLFVFSFDAAGLHDQCETFQQVSSKVQAGSKKATHTRNNVQLCA